MIAQVTANDAGILFHEHSVKLCYNRLLGTTLKGPLYLKPVISKLERLLHRRDLEMFLQLQWLPDCLQSTQLPTPSRQ